MRVLIGGVIGAAVAATVWLGLEFYLKQEFGWLACFVGVVTGLCVHKAAGANASGSYARGALAVAIALGAIVFGRQAYAKVMQVVVNQDKAAVVADVDTDASRAGEDDSEDVSEETDALLFPEMEIESSVLGDQNLPLEKRFTEMDTVWMCVGALAAYVIGKGRDQVRVSVQDEEQPTSDPSETPAE